MTNEIDIWSKGEVVTHLASLVDRGQIKPCIHLGLEYGHVGAYYPRCNKDWASRIDANNVPIDITAYSGPSSYSWPKCPTDCPHFTKSENFQITASKDQYDEGIPSFNENSEESKPLAIDEASNNHELEHPEKVTLSWLVANVEWKFWVTAASIIAAAFCLGVQSSRLSFIKEIFGL